MAVLIGCGDNSPPPTPLPKFGAAATEALCDWAVRCLHVPDRPTCERLIDPKDYDPRRAIDSVEAGRAIYDPIRATDCLEATRDGFCLTPPLSSQACADAIRGTVAAGGACTASRECAAGARCELDECPSQCCLGVCGAAPEPATTAANRDPGEACEGHDDCREDSYCETDRRCRRFPAAEGERCLFGCARGDLYCDLATLTCKRYGRPGESCAELFCDPAWAVCDGVCRPRPGLGERCNESDRLCVPTTSCDPGSEVCVPRRGLGEACESGRECERECDLAAGACVPYATCTD